jgi:hypothetical protein
LTNRDLQLQGGDIYRCTLIIPEMGGLGVSGIPYKGKIYVKNIRKKLCRIHNID